MDGRGGCCIARFATTGAYDMSKVNRIMLRFRPIAPKPVAGGATASDGSSSESRGTRTRRKYVRDNNTNKKRTNQRIRRRKTDLSSAQEHTPPPAPAVTLSLLPETPDPKTSSARDLTASTSKEAPVWLSFENRKLDPASYWYSGGGGAVDGAAAEDAARRLGGWHSRVTVECVTEAWVEGDALGSTDEERRVKLSRDTCPGFISDGYGRVTWTNEAYREMVGLEAHEGEGLVSVFLAMKKEVVNGVVLVQCYPSFTCRVRVVQYARGKERSSLTVPCDVWRMDSGGFAWRLDVKAALSL